MSATRWILGCTLAAAISSPALAARDAGDLGTQDLGQHSAGSNTRSRTIDSGAATGGELSSPTTSRSSEAPATSRNESGDGAGTLPVSTGARQAPSSHSSVGWQSLLPGSIQ